MERSQTTWTVEELAEEVARTDRYAGGGAIASMSLVGAAATAELVFQLSSSRRRTTESDLERLQRAILVCQELRSTFATAIDQDIESLTELMNAQRDLRQHRKASGGEVSGDVSLRHQQAVAQAIETPLRIARDANRLLRTVSELQHLARPFTASDLGAAAATAVGAIKSLLYMAEVNLSMVESDEASHRLASELEISLAESIDLEQSVAERTRSVIR